ncbi:MAG: DUF4342 domain-containing protein [Chloroflexota bacterium]
MTQSTTTTTIQSTLGRLARNARNTVSNSTTRTLVLRRKGNKLFEINQALTLGIGVVLFFINPFLLVLGGVIYYAAGIEIEVIRELSDKEKTVIELDEEA